MGKTQLENSFVSIRKKVSFPHFNRQRSRRRIFVKRSPNKNLLNWKKELFYYNKFCECFFRFLPRQSDDATLNSLFSFLLQSWGCGTEDQSAKKTWKVKRGVEPLSNPSRSPRFFRSQIDSNQRIKEGGTAAALTIEYRNIFFRQFWSRNISLKRTQWLCTSNLRFYFGDIHLFSAPIFVFACGDRKVNTNFGLCRGWKPNDLTFNRLFSTFVRLCCAANQFHLFLCLSVCLWASLRSSLLRS